jgi:hypothetical protein
MADLSRDTLVLVFPLANRTPEAFRNHHIALAANRDKGQNFITRLSL